MTKTTQANSSVSQREERKSNTKAVNSDLSSTLDDELLVDMETSKGRLILKKSVRSGMVAIQYND